MPQRRTSQFETLESRSLLSGTLLPQTITVRVYFDHNSDLHRNRTEAGIAGFHVTAKGLRDAQGLRMTAASDTDASGIAKFTTYVDSTSTHPGSASVSLGTVDKYRCLNIAPNESGAVAGTAAPSIEFGMVDYITVSGHIGYYYKSSSDASAGLPSRVVFDDTNKNAKRDSGEQSTQTDDEGNYALTLHAGAHTLRVATNGIWSAAPGSRLVQSYTARPGRYAPPVDMTPMMTNPVTITVLAGYTTAADHFLFNHNRTSITKYISKMFYAANKVFANSDTNVRLSLLAATETSYVESGSIDVDLTHLHDRDDGKMDDLLAARDSLKADLVTLISAPDSGDTGPDDDNSTIGLGYQFERGKGNDQLAFTVIRLENTADDGFTLAHEIGHNLGAGHDAGNVDDDILTAPYAHGYRFRGADGKPYQDVMAYGSGIPLPFFSTPRFKYAGKAIGNADTADNARIIREIAAEVALYR